MNLTLPDLLAVNPLVSIVTISYNQGAYLRQCIESVLSQTYPHIEYIIIDGGSTDDSYDIIQEYSKSLRHFESLPDQGPAHGLNKGFKHASGSVFGYINADDYLHCNAVEKAVACLVRGYDIVAGSVFYIDSLGRPFSSTPKAIMPQCPVYPISLLCGTVVNQQGSFFKSSVHVPFNQANLWMWDYEHFVHMLLNGARFRSMLAVQGYFRFHPSSITVKYKKDKPSSSLITPTDACRLRIRSLVRAKTSENVYRFTPVIRILFFIWRNVLRVLLYPVAFSLWKPVSHVR